MRLLRLVGWRSYKPFRPGANFDDFWVRTIRDICATLDSVRRHGGFVHLCGDWRRTARADCLSALNELISILNEWKIELEHEPPAGRSSTTS